MYFELFYAYLTRTALAYLINVPRLLINPERLIFQKLLILAIYIFCYYTGGGFVWGDRPFYLVKQPQEK